MTDRRIRRTQKAIVSAFIELTKEKDIAKITVAELCKRADIGRGTFYLHYQDVYALLSEIETNCLHDIGRLFDESLPNHRSLSYAIFMEKTAEYLVHNKDLAQLFLNDKMNFTFMKRVKQYFTKREIKAREDEGVNIETIRYQVAYKVTGIVGILQQWVETGMQQTPKEVSTLVNI